MSHLRSLALLGATAALVGCGGATGTVTSPSSPSEITIAVTPTPEPNADIEDNWSGSVVDPMAGAGQFSMRLEQDGQVVAATWGIVFNNLTHTEGGTLTGRVSGQDIQITAHPEAPHSCGFKLTATVSKDGQRIRGDYSSTCALMGNGSINLTRGSLF